VEAVIAICKPNIALQPPLDSSATALPFCHASVKCAWTRVC